MSLRIEVYGLRELQSKLKREIPERLKRDFDSYVREAAGNIAQKASGRAHVRTGRLRASITANKFGDMQWGVSASAPYAAFERARGGSHDFWSPAIMETSMAFRSRAADLLKRVVEL